MFEISIDLLSFATDLVIFPCLIFSPHPMSFDSSQNYRMEEGKRLTVIVIVGLGGLLLYGCEQVQT